MSDLRTNKKVEIIKDKLAIGEDDTVFDYYYIEVTDKKGATIKIQIDSEELISLMNEIEDLVFYN